MECWNSLECQNEPVIWHVCSLTCSHLRVSHVQLIGAGQQGVKYKAELEQVHCEFQFEM